MKIKAKSSFIHGSLNFKRGATVEVADHIGKALIKAGLAAAAGAEKGKRKSEGKPSGPDAGQPKDNDNAADKAVGDDKAADDNKQGTQDKVTE